MVHVKGRSKERDVNRETLNESQKSSRPSTRKEHQQQLSTFVMCIEKRKILFHNKKSFTCHFTITMNLNTDS